MLFFKLSQVGEYRTGGEGPHIVLMDYQTTRARKHPQKISKILPFYL